MLITQTILPKKNQKEQPTVTATGTLAHVASANGCGVLGIIATVIDATTGEPRYSTLKLLLNEGEMLRINNAYLDIEDEYECDCDKDDAALVI